MFYPLIMISVGHYRNTALFNPPPKKFPPWQGSDLSSLGRLIMKKQGLMVVVASVPLFLANFPEGLLNDFRLPRRPLMVRAALLRRSCDGVAAATELRRPAASRSFCASRLDATR